MRLVATLSGAVVAAAMLAPSAARAQQPQQSTWTVVAPEASLAWFALLDELNLDGAGAFPFVAHSTSHRLASERSATGRSANSQTLATALSRSRDFEVLHFVPLYYPSAKRVDLAAALRAAAATPVQTPQPRAALLVAALTNALPADARHTQLPQLADALERIQPDVPSDQRIRDWQRALDSLFVPALTPWLHAEKLNGGRLIISPAIGAEGRLFAGTADRTDNLVAVGAFADDENATAPLMAFAREICFPAVSRAMTASRGFTAADPQNARRASLLAVRCGSDLLDRFLPAQSDAYRAFWLRRAGSTAPTSQFNRVFPSDVALQPMLVASMQRARGGK